MALSAELEALLGELEKVDAAGAKEQRALLEKFPSLQKATQEQRLRQADYDKRMNESKEKLKYADTMKEWADRNVPKFDEMKTERDAAEARAVAAEAAKVELEKKIAAATGKAATDAGVDPDKLAEAVRAKIGSDYVSKTELQKITGDELKKLVTGEVEGARKAFYDTDVPKMAGLNSALTEAQLRFAHEFPGQFLDAEAFVAFLAKEGNNYAKDGKFDREGAYKAFTQPKRTEADFERRVKEEADKRTAKILEERGAQFPGTSGLAATGPLKMRFDAKSKDDPLFGAPVELGDGSAAAAAAAELHTEGK